MSATGDQQDSLQLPVALTCMQQTKRTNQPHANQFNEWHSQLPTLPVFASELGTDVRYYAVSRFKV